MSTELPEPLAHPGILVEPAGSKQGATPRGGNRRLSWGLFVVGLCWVFANSVASSTLLAAKIEILDPDNKVFVLGLATALVGAVSTVALFVWGAVSDLTRSRLGRRSPWILFGALFGLIGLVLMSLAGNDVTLIGALLFYGLLYNALPAAVLAIFPDRIPPGRRGTASAVYGGAQVLGGAVAGILASRFLHHPDDLFRIAAVVMLLGGLLFVLLAPEGSNLDQPRARLDRAGLREAFTFPRDAPDFYWAFAGRFLLLLGLYMVQNFSLYILSDYIGLKGDRLENTVALSGVASLVTIVVGTVVAGPVSDRIGRRKLPIFFASLLFGVAVLIPLVSRTGGAMIAFGAVSGLGLGAFLSVDSALMTEVLPTQSSNGKDLGILNTANTVPGVIAPLFTAAIVGVGVGYAPVFVISLVIIVVGAFSIFKIKSVR